MLSQRKQLEGMFAGRDDGVGDAAARGDAVDAVEIGDGGRQIRQRRPAAARGERPPHLARRPRDPIGGVGRVRARGVDRKARGRVVPPDRKSVV